MLMQKRNFNIYIYIYIYIYRERERERDLDWKIDEERVARVTAGRGKVGLFCCIVYQDYFCYIPIVPLHVSK